MTPMPGICAHCRHRIWWWGWTWHSGPNSKNAQEHFPCWASR